MRLALTSAVLLALAVTGPLAYGQNASVNALYTGASPKGDFAFTWKEQGKFTKPVGRLRWEVPASEFSTGGMDRSFTGYCSEPLVPVVAGNLYRYEIQSPEMPEIYGLPMTDEGVRGANRRAGYVRELFGRYYFASVNAGDEAAPLAFQAALWEVIHESEFPDVASPFDLFTGNFQANYPSVQESPAYVQMAQQYVRSLTGDDVTTFFENTALAGRELVHLKGLATEAGLTGQSQFGLRDLGAGGGVPGFNGATATAGTGIGGIGGGFGGGGGGGFGGILPTTLGGGGGGSGGGGGGGGGDNPNDPTPPTNTPPTTTSGGPPNEEPDNPDDPDDPDDPDNPDNPVPAPAGLVLGAMAIGVLAGRRAILKFRAKA